MEIQIIQETCCNEECGITFWVAKELHERLVSTKRSYYCPNGHGMHYTGESDEAKVRRLESEKSQILRDSSAKITELRTELEKKCKKSRKKKVKK